MDSGAQSALVIKNTEIDTDIRNKTLNNLLNQRSQVWMGHNGIGKTIEVNYIMMKLLRNLGEEGWPKQVAHRIGREIYLYELVDGRVSCSAVEGGGRTLQDVEDFCLYNQKKKKYLVFVFELGETEKDPQLSLTSFIALSSREADHVLKTFCKSQVVKKLVRSPHSVEEALLVTEIMYTVDKEATLLNAGVSATASLAEFQAVMAERIEAIGSVMRDILNVGRFENFECHVLALSNAKKFLHGGLNDLDLEHIPKEAKYYVAPYTLPDNVKLGEFRFLCNKAALAVRANVSEDAEIAAMRLHGFDYQLTEALLLHVLMSDSSPVLVEGWERYEDPGFNTTLNRSHLLQNSPFRMPTAKRVVRFGTQTLIKDASTMHDGEIYRSTVINCPVSCEFFLYENNNGKRRITFYQTTTVPLSQHAFKVTTLEKWFEALGLYEKHNSDVEVVIEAVVDWSQSTTKGMKFLGEQQEPMDIAGLRTLFPGRAISTTIVRAPLYPNAKTIAEKFELSNVIPEKIPVQKSVKKKSKKRENT